MARAIGLWAEAWTIPGTGPGLATKKVAFIPNTEHEWLDPLSETGRGAFSIPAADDSLPLILDPENDVYSMIRIRRPNGTFGGAHVYSWLARRFEDRESDREVDLANVTGAGLEELLKVPVLPFDYPTVDDQGRSFDPDWEWGSPDNKIRNPGFEEPGESIENASFQSGDIFPWWAGAVDGVSATAAVLSTGGHTGPEYARVTPLLPEGGFSTSVDVYPNSDYEFTAWVRADIGKRYQVGASGPEGIRATGPATAVVEEYPGYTGGYEAHYDFLGNGAFQLVTLNFRSGPSQTSTVLSIRDLTSPVDLQPFDVDDVSILGIGIGMAPWEPTHPAHIVSTFEVSQLVTPYEGSYHGHIVSLQYGGGKQKISGIGAGETWTFTVQLQGLVAGHLWGIEIKDRTGRILAQEVQALTGPGTWDELTITTRMPDRLPREEVELWVVNHHTAVSTAYLDGTSFYHGLPAATYGEIMKTLIDDLAINHAPGFEALTFVKYDSFDEVDDSNSTPWVSTHSYKAEVGKTILNVMEDFTQRGYESRVVDLDGTDVTFDVELVIYEPDGLGTDTSADESIALVAGTNILPTEIVRSAPIANDVTVQGADRMIVRVEDAPSIAATQRIGAYVSAPELTGIQSVTERANQELASRKVPVSLRPTVLESPDHTTPYYEFGVGWKVTCIFPPKVPAQGRRIMSIAGKWSAEDEVAIFDLDTDRRVFASNPMLGLTRAVDLLWRKFHGRTHVPEVQPVPDPLAGFSTVPTIFVAAADGARDTSWVAAHYRCTGVDDDLVIQEALDELQTLGGGRLVLSEGTFAITGTMTMPSNTALIGMGKGTVLDIDAAMTGNVIEVGGDSSVENLQIFAQLGTDVVGISSATDVHVVIIDQVMFQGLDAAVRIKGNQWVVSSCWARGLGTWFVSDQDIYIAARIVNNYMEGGIHLGSGQDHVVMGNIIENGQILADASLRCIIADNVIQLFSQSATGMPLHGIGIDGGEDNVVSENHIGQSAEVGIYVAGERNRVYGNYVEFADIGIHLNGGLESQIQDNRVEFSGEHGIQVTDSSDCQIANNVLYGPGQNAADTYDGIILAGNSDRNSIDGNHIRVAGLGGPPRYGINVSAATCDNNAIGENFYFLAADFGTAEFNDAGTNTQLPGSGSTDPSVVSQLLAFGKGGALSVESGSHRMVFPIAATIVGVTASVGVAPTGASVIVDVHKNGTTIFTTQANRPEIAASGFISAHETPDVTAVSAGEYLTVDVDQIGSTLPGEDLTVIVEWRVA